MDPTKPLIGLIGAGISQSLSPAMHEEEARHHGLDLHYQLIDLDRTGALEKVVAGTCGGDGSRCLRAMGREWRRGFEAILDEVDQLTAGRDVAVRLVGDQNIFLSDPSIIRDYGLPAETTPWVPKPFTLPVLTHRVREVLDEE